jgi:hypothetical protein
MMRACARLLATPDARQEELPAKPEAEREKSS